MRIAAKIGLVLLILWALSRFASIGVAEVHWVLSRPVLVIVAVLCVWISQLLGAYRFQIILRRQAVFVDFLSVVMITCASLFSANVLLGTVAGDGIRYLLLSPRSEARSVATLTAIALDRFLGLMGLLSIGLVALFFRLDLVLASDTLSRLALVASALGLATAGAGFIFFGGRAAPRAIAWIIGHIRPGRLARIVAALGNSLTLIANHPRSALYAFVLSILANLVPLIGFYALAAMMPQMTLGPLDFGFVLPTALLANALSITPGGIGVGEGVFEFFAHIVSPHATISFAALFFVYRLIGAAASLPGVIPLLLARRSPVGAAANRTVWDARVKSP